MNHFSIVKFLEEGRLGPISVGSSAEEVRKCFGEPQGEHEEKGRLRALNYYNVQVWFNEGKPEQEVSLVGVYWRDYVSVAAVALESYHEVAQMTLAEFRQYLHRRGVEHATYAPLTFGEQHCLATPAGVYVLFDLGRSKTGVIDSAQVSRLSG